MIVFTTVGRSSAGREREPKGEARVEPGQPRSRGQMSEKDEKELSLGEFMNMQTKKNGQVLAHMLQPPMPPHRTKG
jgi:hypothetical protein